MTDRVEIDAKLLAQAAKLLDACRDRNETMTTAESCTGGLIAATLTAIPGSSDVVERGTRTTSIMPDGLVTALTPKDLADLIAYLESLKAK